MCNACLHTCCENPSHQKIESSAKLLLNCELLMELKVCHSKSDQNWRSKDYIIIPARKWFKISENYFGSPRNFKGSVINACRCSENVFKVPTTIGRAETGKEAVFKATQLFYITQICRKEWLELCQGFVCRKDKKVHIKIWSTSFLLLPWLISFRISWGSTSVSVTFNRSTSKWFCRLTSWTTFCLFTPEFPMIFSQSSHFLVNCYALVVPSFLCTYMLLCIMFHPHS